MLVFSLPHFLTRSCCLEIYFKAKNVSLSLLFSTGVWTQGFMQVLYHSTSTYSLILLQIPIGIMAEMKNKNSVTIEVHLTTWMCGVRQIQGSRCDFHLLSPVTNVIYSSSKHSPSSRGLTLSIYVFQAWYILKAIFKKIFYFKFAKHLKNR
jgi:hypothetical protein